MLFLVLTGLDGPIDFIGDTGLLFTSGAGAWSKSALSNLVVTFLVYLVWAVISLPTYQAGVVRYAINGKWTSMLNFPANIALVLRYPLRFLKYYICWILLLAFVVLCNSILALTVIGVVFVPAMISVMYYVVTAYELGDLAQYIRGRKEVHTDVSQ
jgi:hypothetical protein